MARSNVTIPKKCAVCGKVFEAHRRTAMTCSNPCSKKYSKMKKKLAERADAEAEIQGKQVVVLSQESLDQISKLIDEKMAVRDNRLYENFKYILGKTLREVLK